MTKDDTVDAAIVDADGNVIRVLARGRRLAGEDTPHCFDWDGLSEEGELVPPGKYRLRLSLEEADREATSGERLRVPVGGSRS